MDSSPIPQQYNSLPDSNSGGSQMSAFEAGDIILSPSTPAKKSRKGLVIGIVIGVLVVAGACGVLVWNSIRNNTQDAFNKCVNYLASGEAKTDEIDINNDETKVLSYLVYMGEVGNYKEHETFFDQAILYCDAMGDDALELKNALSVYEKVSAVTNTDILEQKYNEDRENGIKSYIADLKNLKTDYTFLSNVVSNIEIYADLNEKFNSLTKNDANIIFSDKAIQKDSLNIVSLRNNLMEEESSIKNIIVNELIKINNEVKNE